MEENLKLEEMKKVEIEILKKIDEVCSENNIVYSLAGGSAIGAVRHKGFIPWDDDIDIMMLREDYDKLQNVMNDKDYKGIKLLSINNDENFPYPYMKAVSLNTTGKEIGIDKIKDYGVFIDIFPVDKVPTDGKKFNKYIRKIKIIKNIYLIKLYKKQISTSRFKLIQKKCLSILLKPIGLQYIVKKLDKELKKYNDTNEEKYALIFGLLDSGNKDCYIKDFFIHTRRINFENEKFLIIEEYDKYLRDRYGNYMKLPDESQRVTNHNWEYVKFKSL